MTARTIRTTHARAAASRSSRADSSRSEPTTSALTSIPANEHWLAVIASITVANIVVALGLAAVLFGKFEVS
jgi:hypothetical protein